MVAARAAESVVGSTEPLSPRKTTQKGASSVEFTKVVANKARHG